MEKILIAYFSASGVTKRAARKLADAIGADIFEIEPQKPYTNADLNWNNSSSRSSVEMNDPAFRPAILKTVKNPQDYDTLLVGFPVWWYKAPTIINTFLESADFSGKKIALFCTSGSSGVEGCEQDLKKTYGSKYVWKDGKRLTGRESDSSLIAWVKSL